MSTPSNLLYIEVADIDGYLGRTDAYFIVDPTVQVGTLLGALEDVLGQVQACSGGRIVRAQARLGLNVDGFSAQPIEPTGRASQCLGLSFANNGADAQPWDFLVPAVSLSVLSGPIPDMSEDATIDRLADTLENVTPPILGFAFTTNRGGALLPTADGFLTTRKYSRLFSRQKMEVSD